MSLFRLTLDQREGQNSGLMGLLLCFALSICSAQAETYAPADFGAPNRLATIQVSSSDLTGDSSAVSIRCQALVERNGSVGAYHCLSDNSYADRRVISAVFDVIPNQSFVPAIVNGENVRVLMNFAVFVTCGPESCSTMAVRNHGYHLQNLGFDYVSPQPILEGDVWYEGFDYKLKRLDWMPRETGSNRPTGESRFPFIIAADVTEDGEVRASCLFWASYNRLGANAKIAPVRTAVAIENAVESMDEVRYVPGFLDGRPIDLRLYEYTVTPNSTESLNVTVTVRKAITVGCS